MLSLSDAVAPTKAKFVKPGLGGDQVRVAEHTDAVRLVDRIGDHVKNSLIPRYNAVCRVLNKQRCRMRLKRAEKIILRPDAFGYTHLIA